MPLSVENETGRGCDRVIGPGSLNDYETLKPSSLPLLILPVVTRIIMQLAFIILHNSPPFSRGQISSVRGTTIYTMMIRELKADRIQSILP